MKKKSSYKLFGVSIADIVIVIFLIVFIVFAIDFSAPLTVKAKPGDVKVTYTVELYRTTPGFFASITKGQTLYDSEKGYQIGEIVDVYELPFKEDAPNFETNTIRRQEVDGLVNTYVVAETYASYADSAIAIGQYELQVGKAAYLKSKDFASPGYIVIIDVER